MTTKKEDKVIISINEKFHIENDNFGNWTLCKNRETQNGKNVGLEYNEVIGHFSSAENALRKIVDLKVLSTIETMGVEEYIYELRKAYEELKSELHLIGNRIEKRVIELKKEK